MPVLDLIKFRGGTAALWASVNPTQITGWSIGGGVPTPGLAAFAMTFDNLALSAAAIPEPAMVSLILGLGAVGFVLYRRRAKANPSGVSPP